MADEEISQFFAVNNSGNSQEVYKAVIDGLESLQSSELRTRNRQPVRPPASSLLIDGVPGMPFENTTPNPDSFFQGEDIVYDAILLAGGKYVSSEYYDVLVRIKKTPRDSSPSWEGFLDNGIYEDKTQPGRFELWIPSAVTGTFLAGSYYLQIILKEKLGKGGGRFDRQYVALQTYFNIEYGNFSPAPESRQPGEGQQLRNSLVATWPNAPDTIGRSPIADVVNEMLGMR
jgi:hypothetical protein